MPAKPAPRPRRGNPPDSPWYNTAAAARNQTRVIVGLDPALLARIDAAAGPRGRSAWLAAAAEAALARKD